MVSYVKRASLEEAIVIPAASPQSRNDSNSPDSLFSSTSFDSLFDQDDCTEPEMALHMAINVAPPILGLYFNPAIRVSQDFATSVATFCQKTYFKKPGANQVMLFGRAPTDLVASEDTAVGLPHVLVSLLDHLAMILRPILPESTHALLFPSMPTKARQAIVNLYDPGEGITPHVDLLGRYADGIIGVSFGSGCVMRFDKISIQSAGGGREPANRWDLYLPERSAIVLTGEARYNWTHGIDRRSRDYVSYGGGRDAGSKGYWVDREARTSVTFRWMLDGADVLR